MFSRGLDDRGSLIQHEMVLRVVGNVAPAHAAGLASATRLGTLEDLLRWGGDVIDVIVQDEYTHDVIARAPGSPPGFLVFDTT